jgi:cell division protein YceG involved in septum cleavage
VAPEIPAAPETTPVPGDAPHTSIAAEPSRPAREHELAYAPGLAPVADELPLPIVTPPVEHTRVLAPPPPLPPELGGQPAPRRRRASLPARLAAVVMLVVVVAAVGLLAHSLSRSATHTKTIAPPLEVKVLIPEGKTRAQIAEIAAEDRLVGSYGAASKRSPLLDPARYGAPAHTDSLEGFLFPATYDMDAGAPASRLVEEQLVAFRENFGATEVERAHDLHVTPYQLLTVASMVEREAQVPGDRAKIAAVIYNRLHAGMPLGIDATIYYAVELQRGIATYTHELTEAQLHIDSPYNTRIHTGLPPTPISNPGDASIHAAAYPAHVSYLYYVAGADGCGEQVFSNTLAEFEVNVAAYHAALSKHGGRPPTCKHK